MTDEEYLFKQTAQERKRNGYGDRCKKRQGGRYVHLPHDNLTAKERKALDGECKTYDLTKPVEWAEFSVWPNDIKAQYLRSLEQAFGITTTEIARMFNLHPQTLKLYRHEWGCPGARGGGHNKNLLAFEAFCRGERGIKAEKPLSSYIEPPKDVPQKSEPAKGMDVANLAVLLQSLVGTGAKLTIEVTL